jgi:threonine dehydrogenase-like Zn-dependent dehydrogenase
VPFQGPFAIGHECVAEIVALGTGVERLHVGQRVVVPWAVSCGSCPQCLRGLTSKCVTTRQSTLAAFGFGPASGSWGGVGADAVRFPAERVATLTAAWEDAPRAYAARTTKVVLQRDPVMCDSEATHSPADGKAATDSARATP